ncbi:MAG: SHOCT domain-containing protein, partial [Actinobacteria bacterium]|nr:SHOCT domain-containing protein [Actinomycetota bacterium]
MPGLIRAVGRTAVVAGTATAVSGNVRRRQEQKYADQDAGQQAPPQQAPPAGGDLVGKLTQLAEMNASGTLTDEQ